MPFKVGDWIEKEPFGAGQIIEDRSTYFSIRFVTAGEKNLAKDYVTTPSQPPHPATYFQFIATSGDAMFMKPSVAKLFAPAVGVELNYSATPRWITYEKLNETSEIARQRLLANGMETSAWHGYSELHVQSMGANEMTPVARRSGKCLTVTRIQEIRS
jgi:hypothetical protein